MNPAPTVRRILVGREVGIVFGVLLAGSLLISGGFVPAYLAVLFASGVRNVFLPWIGNGVLFYGVSLFFLYFEAVVVTVGYLSVRYLHQQWRRDGSGNVTAR